MKIFECSDLQIEKKNLLIDVLKIDINKKNIISFVGGGGKTSLIYALGNELGSLGKKVIVTTTTHMFKPTSNVSLTGKKEEIIKLLNSQNMITVGLLCEEKDKKSILSSEEKSLEKITGLKDEMSRELIKLADFVLVEADGSKRLPLKMPAKHEPVILDGSDLVVGVCGIDAVGKSIKEICHRPNLVSEFLNCDEEHIINENDIARILLSESGQRKNVKCEYKVVVNKVDTGKEHEIAKNILYEFSKLGENKLILTTFER